jgi:hypothetical protein
MIDSTSTFFGAVSPYSVQPGHFRFSQYIFGASSILFRLKQFILGARNPFQGQGAHAGAIYLAIFCLHKL